MPQFSLRLGTSTGKLTEAGHGTGIRPNVPVVLTGDDCAKNVAIFGGTGTGKTTGIILPFVAQAFSQGSDVEKCGLFAFDIKGDFGDDLIHLAHESGREVIVIGTRRDGGRPCNILEDLSPEMAASFLKSALLIAGNTGGNSAYWVDLATELARNVLGVLSYFPEHYTLYGLHEYIYSESFREILRPQIAKKFLALMQAGVLEPGDSRGVEAAAEAMDEADRLMTYAGYYANFAATEERTRSIVLSQLSIVLSPFTLPEFRHAFCERHSDNVDLRGLIDGDVILVRLPLARYGLVAKTVYTMLKLKFFSIMKSRAVEKSWNQTRYVVFVCDEYHQIVTVAKDAISDGTFWDTSRSNLCAGIIAAQGYSSFLAAIGNDALTRSFLQNFRQQITFSTEDEATIKHFSEVLGQVEVEREGHSRTRSARAGRGGVSVSTSTNLAMKSVIDPQTIRCLAQGEALAMLSIRGQPYDDVIRTKPLYLSNPTVRTGAVA